MLQHLLPILGALLASPSAPWAAPQQGRRAEDARAAAPEEQLLTLRDPRFLSPRVALVGFDSLRRGPLPAGALGPYGMHLSAGQGGTPRVWRDGQPRGHEPSGRSALRVPIVADDPRAPSDDECALRIVLEQPVNRLGFEARRIAGGHMNLLVSCYERGRELGTPQFFDLSGSFSFVGVQCATSFDEVRLAVTNPAAGILSLDNLRHELDLRDGDHDGFLDFADLCPDMPSMTQADSDGDGHGDACDAYPFDPENDLDGDGLGRNDDNCPELFNPDQRDHDGDGIGDTCDVFPFGADQDNDGVGDAQDNCPTTFNPEQADCDLDGVGDACDPTLISPSSVSFTLAPGACTTLTKSLCLPPAPPVVDVVIAFDTTASMGGEIQKLRQFAISFISDVRDQLPQSDIRFALVTFKDYPGTYSSCGYTNVYSRTIDQPFRVEAPIGTTDLQLLLRINALTAAGGKDFPEAYARVLWEVQQPDSGINFRSGSARFVLLVGDSAPHDCQVASGLAGCADRASSGLDPGRDGLAFTADDIDFQEDALFGMEPARIRLLTVFSGPQGFCAWDRWSRFAGGLAIQADTTGQLPPGTNLAGELVTLIRHPTVNRVTYSAVSDCGLAVTFDPPLIDGPIDVSSGAQVSFQETICVPATVAPGTSLDCAVQVFADEVLLGTQTIHVDVPLVPCKTLTFEGPVNGWAVKPDDFAAQGVTVTSKRAPYRNVGLAIFDSTRTGPNAACSDPDLLVDLGNVLILQENNGQSVPGIYDLPDDSIVGGEFLIDFAAPARLTSIDMIDIDVNRVVHTAFVRLTDVDGRRRVYSLPDAWTNDRRTGPPGYRTLDLTTLQDQVGFQSTATAFEDPGFRADQVVHLSVELPGSGAIDNLVFCQ